MNIDNIKKEIKEINLTPAEKQALFDRILSSPTISPYAPVPSKWKFVYKSFSYAALVLFLLIISGGTVAYAALGSIPGDKLYAVKIKVTEPLLDTLSLTKVAKAKREATKAISRLDEAEKLALKEKLTPETRIKLEKHFEKNVANFDDKVKSIESLSEKRVAGLRASFDSSLNSRANNLEKIGEDQKNKRFDKNEKEEPEASLLGIKLKAKASIRKEYIEQKKEERNATKDEDKNYNIKNQEDN